jgi:phage head maturation protease
MFRRVTNICALANSRERERAQCALASAQMRRRDLPGVSIEALLLERSIEDLTTGLSRYNEHRSRKLEYQLGEMNRAATDRQLHAMGLRGSKEVRADAVYGCIAATESPYDCGKFIETLSCDPDAVDYSAAFSVLLNHDLASIVGGIRTIALGGELRAQIEVCGSAETETRILVADAIDKGILSGISVGYLYHERDCDLSMIDDMPHVFVKRWRLLEISITPTPADPGAKILLGAAE